MPKATFIESALQLFRERLSEKMCTRPSLRGRRLEVISVSPSRAPFFLAYYVQASATQARNDLAWHCDKQFREQWRAQNKENENAWLKTIMQHPKESTIKSVYILKCLSCIFVLSSVFWPLKKSTNEANIVLKVNAKSLAHDVTEAVLLFQINPVRYEFL